MEQVSKADVLPDVTLTSDRRPEGCTRLVVVNKQECSDHIGFNLTRSQWDPYPWVKSVDQQSPAEKSGLRKGDCLLRVNDEDLLGRKVSDVAKLVKNALESIKLSVWSSPPSDWDPEALVGGPLPDALRRMTKVVSGVLAAMECPICCGTVRPPSTSCPRGHLFCTPCRQPLTSCPLCRVPLNSQNPLRNLLADEVYNCVVEAFELFGDKAQGKLTDSLFGSAKFSKNDPKPKEAPRNCGISGDAEFPPHDMNGRGLKWGTHRLIQRLLPGRARSTDNIARATMLHNRDVSEDRDISRSLSNLHIARSTQSINSLACTAGGSCGSLPSSGFVSRDESFGALGNNTKQTSFHCPVNPDCQESITGNVQEHILKSHGIEITLNATNSIGIDVKSVKPCRALYHPSGLWFYPKCERDRSDEGVLVWCWTDGSGAESSRFQLVVEMWSDGSKTDVLAGYGALKKRNLSLVDEMPENMLEHFENIARTAELPATSRVDRSAKRPMLRFISPVVCLQSFSWNQVVDSHLALYLGDSLLSDDHTIKITIEEK